MNTHYDKIIELLSKKNNIAQKSVIEYHAGEMFKKPNGYIHNYIEQPCKILALIFEKNSWAIPIIDNNKSYFNLSDIIIYHAMYSNVTVFKKEIEQLYSTISTLTESYIQAKYASRKKYSHLKKILNHDHKRFEDILMQAALSFKNKEVVLFLLSKYTYLKITSFKISFDVHKEKHENLKFLNDIYPRLNIIIDFPKPENINAKSINQIIKTLPFLNKIPSCFSVKMEIYNIILNDINFYREHQEVIRNIKINNIEWNWHKEKLSVYFSSFLSRYLFDMTASEISSIPRDINIHPTKCQLISIGNCTILTDEKILEFYTSPMTSEDKKRTFSELQWKINANSIIKNQNEEYIPLTYFKNHISIENSEVEKTLDIQHLVNKSENKAIYSYTKELFCLLIDEYKKISSQINYYDNIFDAHIYFFTLKRNSEFANIMLEKNCLDLNETKNFLLKSVEFYLRGYKGSSDPLLYIDNIISINNDLSGFDFIRKEERYYDDRVEQIRNYLIEKENEVLKNIIPLDKTLVSKKRI